MAPLILPGSWSTIPWSIKIVFDVTLMSQILHFSQCSLGSWEDLTQFNVQLYVSGAFAWYLVFSLESYINCNGNTKVVTQLALFISALGTRRGCLASFSVSKEMKFYSQCEFPFLSQLLWSLNDLFTFSKEH